MDTPSGSTVRLWKSVVLQTRLQIRKAATEQASTICDYAQEKGEVIRDKAKKFHEAGEEYVKEKPTQSVLIAMGVGLLIGLLIRRR